MSWSQTLRDRGVVSGLLGVHDAPNHTGDPRDPHTIRNLGVIRELCGGTGGIVMLTKQHEPRRIHILTLAESEVMQQAPLVRRISTPASGALLMREDMQQLKIQTICTPVNDHPVISVQVVGSYHRVLASAMLRATLDRTHGHASVIETFFEVLAKQCFQHVIEEIHFYLSAGRGPCCFSDEGRYLQTVAERFRKLGHSCEDHEFRGYDSHTGKFGVSMLSILAAEITRCSRVAGKNFVIHRRDNDCTACSGESGTTLYFSGDEGKFNLAFFYTALEIPQRSY